MFAANAPVSAAVSSLPGLIRFSSGRYDCLPLLVLTLATLEMVAFPTFGAIPTQRKYLCTRDLIYRPHACSALVLAIIFLFPRAHNSPVVPGRLRLSVCPVGILARMRPCCPSASALPHISWHPYPSSLLYPLLFLALSCSPCPPRVLHIPHHRSRRVSRSVNKLVVSS